MILLMVFAVNGCIQTQTQPDDVEPETEVKTDEEAPEMEPEPSVDYVGTWLRTNSTPATLILKKTSYTSSTAECTASGDVIPGDSSYTMTIKSTDCPSPPNKTLVGLTVHYTYTIKYNEEKDVEIMTIVTNYEGTTITETYERQ